ncbi:DUF2510 domain-containing protein [Microbacterium sp. NPDC055903]
MSTPAGWYDDGSGRQRWWDGAGWTEQVAEPAPSAPPSTPAPPDAPSFAPPFVLPSQPSVGAGAGVAWQTGSTDHPGAMAFAATPTTMPVRRSRTGLIIGLVSAGAAIAGIGAIVLVSAVLASSASDDAEQPGPTVTPWQAPADGTDPEEETVFWDEIEVGDCWRYDEDDWESGYADLVPCDIAHSDEIYYEFTLEGDEYPGDKTILRDANAVCIEEFAAFAGISYEESELEFWSITPTMMSWNKAADRTVQCSIFDPEDEATTGTLKNATR